MLALHDYQGLAEHFRALALGGPRLFMFLQIAPFLAPGLVTGQLRTALGLALYAMVHPLVLTQLPEGGTALYLGLAAKELLLGFGLAFLAGRLFWMVQSAGFLIDNQRGASMAAGPDPLSGEETSPLGSFLFQCLVFIFFASGAFLGFLEVLYASYRFWPVNHWTPLFTDREGVLFFAGQVDWLMAGMLLLAGPIVVACLLIDFALGLINRFASQLNVYVLAMPIKSGVAAFFMVLYLGYFIWWAPGFIQDSENVLRKFLQ